MLLDLLIISPYSEYPCITKNEKNYDKKQLEF